MWGFFEHLVDSLIARMAARKARREERKARQLRRDYGQKHGVNLRCPHCQAWSSDTPEHGPRIRPTPHPIAVAYECRSCGVPSYWVCEAGFWFRAAELGIPDYEIVIKARPNKPVNARPRGRRVLR